MNRDFLAHATLRPVRSGIFAGELLAVEVVGLVSAIAKRFVARAFAPAEGIPQGSLDPVALMV